MRLSHPVPSQPASVRACRHAGTGEKFPPSRIRRRPSSDVHKNIPSSLFRRGARTQSTRRRRRRRRDCTPVPTRSPRRRRHRSFPACGGVGPVARSRSKKGKCQNLSPAILFWLLFLLLLLFPELAARFPAPKKPS